MLLLAPTFEPPLTCEQMREKISFYKNHPSQKIKEQAKAIEVLFTSCQRRHVNDPVRANTLAHVSSSIKNLEKEEKSPKRAYFPSYY